MRVHLSSFFFLAHNWHTKGIGLPQHLAIAQKCVKGRSSEDSRFSLNLIGLCSKGCGGSGLNSIQEVEAPVPFALAANFPINSLNMHVQSPGLGALSKSTYGYLDWLQLLSCHIIIIVIQLKRK